jgi:hypothetical protein
MDPHQCGNLDPDPHQSDELDRNQIRISLQAKM